MTRNNTQEEIDHLEYMDAYRQANVASILAQTEDGQNYIPGAELNLAKDVGILTGPAIVYEEVMRETPEARAKFIEISSRKYAENRDKVKIGDLIAYYMEAGKISDSASDEIINQFSGLFAEYSGKTIDKIKEEIGDQDHILNPRSNSTDKEKNSARVSLQQRQLVLNRLSVLESYALERGRQRAVEASIQGTLESMVKQA